MRYLGLIFIFSLMWWTWSAMEAPAIIPDFTHADVQEDLKRVITESILEDVPTANDIAFEKLWTQTLHSNEMKATFSYSYDNGLTGAENTRVGVDGSALLRRALDKGDEFDVWNVEEIYFLNNRVNFKEGVTVRAKSNSGNE